MVLQYIKSSNEMVKHLNVKLNFYDLNKFQQIDIYPITSIYYQLCLNVLLINSFLCFSELKIQCHKS